MYEALLEKLGLSVNESRIYELLLVKGRTKARDVVAESGLGRGNVYNILTNLVSRGLATVIEGKQQVYQAAEPSALSTLVEEQKRRAERLSAEFRDELPKLLSTFNLTTGKPAVRIFEGLEGVQTVVDDALASKTEILTYYDYDALSAQLSEIDERQYRAYVRKGLHKKIIVADSEKSRAYFAEALQNTIVYFVKDFPTSFASVVQIYDGRVAFISLKNAQLISVIIEDVAIYHFLSQQFHFIASLASSTVGRPLV